MGRTAISKAPTLLLRTWKQFQGSARISSKAAKANPTIFNYSKDTSEHSDLDFGGGGSGQEDMSVSWIPHPRTGIFFPPGQESVMADVPDGAASFDVTFWIRNVDGVDKPDPDHHYPC